MIYSRKKPSKINAIEIMHYTEELRMELKFTRRTGVEITMRTKELIYER